MHLKHLILHGFKTFADRTELQFPAGLTCIVGPNGSGKSNISDAIQWVLGENNVRDLRGATAQDVIFSGNDRRRPFGMAEVSLTFDNSTRILPLDFSEITVTRRLYRSGESECFINRVSCRLRDLYELFLDTGIGRDAYAMVSQGEIDRLLSARAEDRRAVFEEAAGVKKYQVRKREALRKLETTEQNLLRVRDVIGEIETQLGPLQRQAAAARRWRDLLTRLARLEDAWFGTRLCALEAEQAALEQEVTGCRRSEADVEGELSAFRAAEQRLQPILQELGAAIETARAAELETLQREAGAREELARLESRLAEDRRRLENAGQSVRELARRAEEQTRRATDAARVEQQLVEETGTLRDSLVLAERRARETREAHETASGRLEQMRQSWLAGMRRQAEATARVQSLETRVQSLHAQRARGAEALHDAAEEQTRWETERESFRTAGASTGQRLQQTREAVRTVQEAARAAEAAESEARKTLNRSEAERNARAARLQALRELQERGEDLAAGARTLLQAARRGQVPGQWDRFAALLSAPAGWERAVESALGPYGDALLCDSAGAARAGLAWLRSRKLSVLALPDLPQGEWRTANGEQPTAGGEWRMVKGEWRTAIGEQPAAPPAAHPNPAMLPEVHCAPGAAGSEHDLPGAGGAVESGALPDTILGDRGGAGGPSDSQRDAGESDPDMRISQAVAWAEVLLARTLLVPELPDQPDRGRPDVELWVAQDGSWLTGQGARSGGPAGTEGSAAILLARQREVEQLVATLPPLETALTAARQALGEAEQASKAARTTLAARQAEEERLRLEQQAALRDVDRRHQEATRAQHRVERMRADLARVEQEISAAEASLAAARRDAPTAPPRSAVNEAPAPSIELVAAQDTARRCETERRQADQVVTDLRVRLAGQEQRTREAGAAARRLADGLERLNREQTEGIHAEATLRDAVTRSRAALEPLGERLTAARASLVVTRETLSRLQKSRAERQEELEQIRARTAALTTRLRALLDTLRRAEVRLAEVSGRRTGLANQWLETAASRPTAAELAGAGGSAAAGPGGGALAAPTDLSAPGDGSVPEPPDLLGVLRADWDREAAARVLAEHGAPEEELGRLRRQLRALGAVNPEADAQLATARERFEFLSTQQKDLETAREQLLGVVGDLDAASRDTFLKAFREIAVAFEEMFQKLFGGGAAELRLTDPEDVLQTGVDVFVQLPGKKPQNLMLLSGGERALTATAMLFALLKVRPSPFCVLDEVDAPLDESNVHRFAAVLREFLAQTQFLVVTHNRGTMERADVLYGVTMQEQGVSKVLSCTLSDPVVAQVEAEQNVAA